MKLSVIGTYNYLWPIKSIEVLVVIQHPLTSYAKVASAPAASGLVNQKLPTLGIQFLLQI